MTAGLVSFVFEGENKSFGLKNRIFLILIYLIQAMISLYNLLSLMSLRLRSESIGYLSARMIVMGFFASRMLVLFAYSFLSSAGKKRPLTRKIYFLVANLNLPVHFESFQNDKDSKNAKIQTYTEFIFLWTLNIIENIIRSVCVLMLASDEVMSQTLLHFRKTDLLLATISGEILVFILISFYFRRNTKHEWLFTIYCILQSMSFLTHLVLPNFCTNNIIRALALKCRDTLTMLEIDHSLRVSDKVVGDMLKLTNLTLLSMAGDKISSWGSYHFVSTLVKFLQPIWRFEVSRLNSINKSELVLQSRPILQNPQQRQKLALAFEFNNKNAKKSLRGKSAPPPNTIKLDLPQWG